MKDKCPNCGKEFFGKAVYMLPYKHMKYSCKQTAVGRKFNSARRTASRMIAGSVKVL